MSDSVQNRPTRGPEPPANDRLESWKEIAAYLDKDVSTARRWEKRAGLPVYHHIQDSVRNVYAYRAELDAWQDQRRVLLDDNAGSVNRQAAPVVSVDESLTPPYTSAQGPRWWGRWPAVAAGILVAVVVTASLAWVAWNGRARTAEQLATLDVLSHEGDSVLITRFENLTGEALYDGTLKLALERQLSNSSVVRVASPERVEDALRLMKRPLDTVVDASVGREVALRDGGIRVILTGHIEKFGPNYLLTVQLLDPQDGRVLASVSEDARDESAITSALRSLSSRVREVLGEALPLIEASERRLQKVTTPSLRALQFYSRGYARYREEQRLRRPANHAVSAELFQQAIAEDPHFAMAYNMLGWSVRFQDREEALRHWARAVELSPSTTERDRLFLEGTYYTQTGQYEEAAAKYETLLRLHPDHYYAANNLGAAYRELGLEAPTEILVRAADSRPNNVLLQMRAAGLLTRTWQLDRAKVYVERASALGVPETPVRRFAVVWRDLFPAYEHWFRGEVDEAFREVEAVTRTIAAGSPLEREGVAIAASFYLAFGQLGKAKDLFETLSDQQLRHQMLAWLADCVDDQEGLKEHLSAGFPVPRLLRKVRAGLPLEPADLDTRGECGGCSPSTRVYRRQLALGELARRRGDWRDAIALLEPGVEGARATGFLEFYLGSESLATAWQQVGSETQALHVLEEAAQVKARYPDPIRHILTGAFGRFHVQARLADEYRQVGRIDEAVAIEDEVLHMLKYADDDHPVVRQIRESQASRAAVRGESHAAATH